MKRTMYMNGKQITPNTLWLIMLMAAVAAGAVCGALFGGGGNGAAFISYRMNAPLGEIILTSFRGCFFLTAVCFALGFSAAGQPFEAIVPFFCGTGFGAAASELYSAEGIFPVIVLLMPGAAAAAAAVSVAAREAMRMSLAVCRRTFSKGDYTPADIKLYLQKFLIITAMSAAAAVIDGGGAVIYTLFWQRG